MATDTRVREQSRWNDWQQGRSGGASPLILVPEEPTIIVRDLRLRDMRDVSADASASGWKLTLKRGILQGAGVSVSGQGAWARLSGEQTFTIRTIDHSVQYQQLKSGYNISAGISGFWSWLGFG